jgi:hypothetical protein
MSRPREPTLSPLSKYEREERNATVAREGESWSLISRVAEDGAFESGLRVTRTRVLVGTRLIMGAYFVCS